MTAIPAMVSASPGIGCVSIARCFVGGFKPPGSGRARTVVPATLKSAAFSADMLYVLKKMLGLAALIVAASGFASADSIQFIGAPTGVNDGQYYDLPYEIKING